MEVALARTIVFTSVFALMLAACDGGEPDPRVALCDYFFGDTLTTFFEVERHHEMDERGARLRELASRVDDEPLRDAGLVTAQLAEDVATGDGEAFQRFIWAPLDAECGTFSSRYRG